MINPSAGRCCVQNSYQSVPYIYMLLGANSKTVSLPANVTESLYFQGFGGWASFVAASLVLLVQVRYMPQTWKQVRPRMLLLLLFLDALAGLCNGMDSLPAIVFSKKYDSPATSFAIILNSLGVFFSWSSFTWTCCIACHAHVVVRTNLAANSDMERRWEKRYLLLMVVVMGCVFLPCGAYFAFGPTKQRADIGGGDMRVVGLKFDSLLAVFLVVQWVFVGGVCAHLYVALEVSTESARVYRRQILLFLLVFLVLTVQPMAFFIRVIADLFLHNFSSITSSKADRYLFDFGSYFYEYMGVANAIVWGVSRSCLHTCIKKHYSDENHGVDMEQGNFRALQLPLILHEATQTHEQAGAGHISLTGAEAEISMSDLKMEHTPLGKGGFGVVFAGTYHGNAVAVKQVSVGAYEIDPHGGSSYNTSSHNNSTGMVQQVGGGGAMARALREAAILAELRHPNTVVFYGVGVQVVDTSRMTAMAAQHAASVQYYYYVTELCDTSLDRMDLGVGQMDGTELWQILVQVASGLQYLHSKDIMHRDLKPGNVLVSETKTEAGSGEVVVVRRTYKVCDFGLSRMLGEEKAGEVARTITGNIGTALWMAPEMMKSDNAQLNAHPFASDVCAFGVLAWQVLSGEQPYVESAACQGKSLYEIKNLVVEGMRPEVPQNAEEEAEWDWPEGAAGLMQQCWAERAEARPRSVEVVRDLQLMEEKFTPLHVHVLQSHLQSSDIYVKTGSADGIRGSAPADMQND